MKYTRYRGNKKESKFQKFIVLLTSPKGIFVSVLTVITTYISMNTAYIIRTTEIHKQNIVIHPPVADKLTEAKARMDKGSFGAGVSILQDAIKDPQNSQWHIVYMLSDGIRFTSKAPTPLNKNPKSVLDVRPEIVDAINIITGRKIENDIKDEEYSRRKGVINLRGTNLHDINLIGKNLSKVSFDQSYLYQVNLTDANLTNTYLRGTYLRAGKLEGANLENARLDTIKGDRTDLIKVSLVNANLNKADLSGVKFFDDNLIGDNLKRAKSRAKQNIQKACNWHLATYSPDMNNILGVREMDKNLDQRPECQKFIH